MTLISSFCRRRIGGTLVVAVERWPFWDVRSGGSGVGGRVGGGDWFTQT